MKNFLLNAASECVGALVAIAIVAIFTKLRIVTFRPWVRRVVRWLRGWREAVLEVDIDQFNKKRSRVWISRMTKKIVNISSGQITHHREYIGEKVKIVEKNYDGKLPKVKFKTPPIV